MRSKERPRWREASRCPATWDVSVPTALIVASYARTVFHNTQHRLVRAFRFYLANAFTGTDVNDHFLTAAMYVSLPSAFRSLPT